MTPILLAYQIEPGKLGKMQVVCLRLGIRVQAIYPVDFGQPIGALAGELPRNPDADGHERRVDSSGALRRDC